jgi:hypothetical protein
VNATTSARIHRLAAVTQRLRTHGDALREQVCRDTPHMLPDVMAEGLDVSLADWDEAGLASLWSEEQTYMEGAVLPRLVAVVLGGVLPPSHLQAVCYPYLLGADVIVQHPSADPLFPQLLADALGDAVTVVGRLGLGGVLGRVDAVVAVGDDDSVHSVAGEVAVGTPFLGFGHQTAIAIVHGPTVNPPLAADLFRDITLFDQLGCLSPREILVVGGMGEATSLAREIAAQMEALPQRGPLGVAIEGAVRSAREMALTHGHTTYGPDDLSWGIQVVDGGQWRGTPGGRHIIVRTVDSALSIPEVLAPVRGWLSSVAVGDGLLDAVAREGLVHLGASRIVRPGRLQCPPPTWPHDGRRPLASLCRWFGQN